MSDDLKKEFHPVAPPPPRGFDEFGPDYNERLDACLRGLGGRDGRYYNRLKCDGLLRLARKYLGDTRVRDFLDLGCGTGLTERTIAPEFRFGVGLDMSPGMVRAAGDAPGNCAFALGDAGRLPFADRSFDLVFSFTMLHHLEDPTLAAMLPEVRRVLRPGGLMAHFDHNPYNYLTRQVAKYCDFDQERAILRPLRQVKALARGHGFTVVESGYLAFIPAALSFLEPLERLFRPLPIGGQYYLAARVTGEP